MAQNHKSGTNTCHFGQQAASIRKKKAQAANRAELVASATALGITPAQLLEQRRLEASLHKSGPKLVGHVSAVPKPYGKPASKPGLGVIFR